MFEENKNFNNESVTDFSISGEHETIFRRFLATDTPDQEILLSGGLKDKKNLLPIINLFSTSAIEAYSKDDDTYLFTEKLMTVAAKKAYKLLGFHLPIKRATIIEMVDSNSGATVPINKIGEIFALLMLSRSTDKYQRSFAIGFDVILSTLKKDLEKTVISTGFWKNNFNTKGPKLIDHFIHQVYGKAVKRIGIAPIGYGPYFSDNDPGIRGVNCLIDLAWTELFVANIHRVKFSTCPYCGKTYSLEGTGSWRKVTCGQDWCKKRFRTEAEKANIILNEEEVKKSDRFRKAKSRAIRTILDGKSTILDEARKLNIPASEIENWVNEYKLKKRKKRELK